MVTISQKRTREIMNVKMKTMILRIDYLSVIFKCHTCQDDHWTLSCPFKHTQLAQAKASEASKLGTDSKAAPTNKYVAPMMREGAVRARGGSRRARAGAATTSPPSASNLSNFAVEADLEDLVKGFGPVQRMHLAKEKSTGHCKGFAYAHFKSRVDVAKAIQTLNGHGYDHLNLNVEWSKPPTNN